MLRKGFRESTNLPGKVRRGDPKENSRLLARCHAVDGIVLKLKEKKELLVFVKSDSGEPRANIGMKDQASEFWGRTRPIESS